jgi:hypothetical protein
VKRIDVPKYLKGKDTERLHGYSCNHVTKNSGKNYFIDAKTMNINNLQV